MASSHKSRNVNGDPSLNPQDKSIDVRMPDENKKPVDGRDFRMQQHLPQNQPENEPFQEVEHFTPADFINAQNKNQVKIQETDYSKKPDVKPLQKFVDESVQQSKLSIIGGSQKYDFDDVLIVPKSQTYLNSRYNDIDPYRPTEFPYAENKGKFLPLMTAPMDSVVNQHNAYIFNQNKITVVLPRTLKDKATLAGAFNSYGLKDRPNDPNLFPLVLLDVANGHMSSVLQWCHDLKKQYPKCKIMAGNIANPQTYSNYCASEYIDYARIGIGNGNGCLTTQQTGVGYPMASLIAECYEIKIKAKYPVKIVADGGMKNYSNIIKALALGADYVMVGSMFSKAIESSAPNYWGRFKVGKGLGEWMYEHGYDIHKEFRGMSTKQAQKALGNTEIKTSEGIVRKLKVEYSIEQWVENFEHYLRSAMSYSNAKNLQNFIGHASVTLISNNAFNRFKK